MEERRVHPECVYASNPYHECVESCLLKISQKTDSKPKKKSPGSYILVIPRRLSGKKKGSDMDAERKPSKELNEDFLKSFDMSNTRLNSQQFSFKKVATWDAELMLPKKLNEKKNAQDAPINMEKHQQPQAKSTKDMSKKSTSNMNVTKTADDTDKVRLSSDLGSLLLQDKSEDGPEDLASKNSSMTVMNHSFEATDDEDAQSVITPSSPPVGNYKVKENLSSILQSILLKYGDIAASCKLESVVMRSYYLECICSVIQELQSASITQMKRAKVKELLSIVKDVEASGINVDWLRNALNKIAEAVDLLKRRKGIEKAIINCKREMEPAEKELETQLQDVAEKERELAAAKARVEETQARMARMEEKSSLFEETMASIRSKVGQIDCKTLVDQILQCKI